MKRVLVFLALTATTLLHSQVPDNLVVEGVPPIPEELRHRVRPLRSATCGERNINTYDIGLGIGRIAESRINPVKAVRQSFGAGVIILQAINHRFKRDNAGGCN